MDKEDGRVVVEKNLIDYITNFYRNLFGEADTSNISLCIENSNKISSAQKEMLIREFSLEEIKTTIFQMDHNKSPGPDGFNAKFYQHF